MVGVALGGGRVGGGRRHLEGPPVAQLVQIAISRTQIAISWLEGERRPRSRSRAAKSRARSRSRGTPS